jgi:hypothetical protein
MNTLLRARFAGTADENAPMHRSKSLQSNYRERTVDVAAILDHLGNRSVQDTMIYVDITNRRRDRLAEKNHDWK